MSIIKLGYKYFHNIFDQENSYNFFDKFIYLR